MKEEMTNKNKGLGHCGYRRVGTILQHLSLLTIFKCGARQIQRNKLSYLQKRIWLFIVKKREHQTLLPTCYAVCAIAIAGRSAETYKLLRPEIEETTVDQQRAYKIQFHKVKNTDEKVEDDTWHRENTADWPNRSFCHRAIACFKPDEREGRFFRKLRRVNRNIASTKQVIGANEAKARNTQKPLLNHSIWIIQAATYTSHSSRTGTTFDADAGLSLPRIKAHTGHKSDTVAQNYIDQSMVQKITAAKAVSLLDEQKVPQSSSSSSSSTTLKRSRTEMTFSTSEREAITLNFSGTSFTVACAFTSYYNASITVYYSSLFCCINCTLPAVEKTYFATRSEMSGTFLTRVFFLSERPSISTSCQNYYLSFLVLCWSAFIVLCHGVWAGLRQKKKLQHNKKSGG